MRKKRRRSSLIPTTAPDSKQMVKWSAESMAETMIRHHPKMKRAKNLIMDEVMKAGERGMRKAMGPMKGRAEA